MNMTKILRSKSNKTNELFYLSNSNFHKHSKSTNLSLLKNRKETHKSVKTNLKENKSGSFRIHKKKDPRYVKSKKQEEEPRQLKRHYFKFHMIVGKGGFGKVWIVTYKAKKRYYALKEMSKTKIAMKKSINSVMNEKNILSVLNHPFIVNMKASFQDRDNLYLVMDLLTGGDLRFHICYCRRFTEIQTRFFVACLILALEYIHKNKFLHRDVKPENIVFDERGFLRLTDFGIARKENPNNEKETSGTPGYMAPEVMCRQPHTYAVDYYAVGIIAYECMLGKRPYNGRSRREIREQILARQAQIKMENVPRGWSLESADFINALIQRKPYKRLGFNGVAEIKNHKWFKGFNWSALENKKMEPPFVPNVRNVFEYLRSITETDTEEDANLRNSNILRRKSIQDLFKDYDVIHSSKEVKPKAAEKPTGRKKLATIKLNSAHRSLNINKSRHLSRDISSRISGRLDQIWKNLSKKKFR